MEVTVIDRAAVDLAKRRAEEAVKAARMEAHRPFLETIVAEINARRAEGVQIVNLDFSFTEEEVYLLRELRVVDYYGRLQLPVNVHPDDTYTLRTI